MNSWGGGIRITCSPLPRRIEFSADNEKNDGVRFRSPVSRTKRTPFFYAEYGIGSFARRFGLLQFGGAVGTEIGGGECGGVFGQQYA